MDRTTRVLPTLNGEGATFRKATPPEMRSAKTQRDDRPAPALDQAERSATARLGPASVAFISERTRKGFHMRPDRALQLALRAAQEAIKPGTEEARVIALLRAVGLYAAHLGPTLIFEAGR